MSLSQCLPPSDTSTNHDEQKARLPTIPVDSFATTGASFHKMDLDREECLKVLDVLGIDLPQETKLPLEVLQKRVGKALDCTQTALKSKKINPSELKKWRSSPEKSLFEATKTINMMEATQNQAKAIAAGGQHLPPTLFVDPFTDLRQSVMSFGMNCESGLRVALIEDPEEKYSCTIRVSRTLFSLLSKQIFI